jgi:hypothetical protein
MMIYRTSKYASLISKLSKESLDEIQGNADWNKFESSKYHQILTTSKVASVIRKLPNKSLLPADVTMDFLCGLNTRYAEFKAEKVNDMQKDGQHMILTKCRYHWMSGQGLRFPSSGSWV